MTQTRKTPRSIHHDSIGGNEMDELTRQGVGVTSAASAESGMVTALTKQGRMVTLDVGTPVHQGGKLVGFYYYTWSNETYPVHSGGVAHYATRVYIPNKEHVS